MAGSMPLPDVAGRGAAGVFKGTVESHQPPLRHGIGQCVDQPLYPQQEAPMQAEAPWCQSEIHASAVPLDSNADDKMPFDQTVDRARQRPRISLQTSGQHRKRRGSPGELAHDQPVIEVQLLRRQRALQAAVHGLLRPNEIEQDPAQMRSMQ